MSRRMKIGGREFPALYSLRVAMYVAERYGSAGKALFDETLPAAQLLEQRLDVMRELIVAGAVFQRLEEGTEPGPMPTAEELMDLISARGMEELVLEMMECITEEDRADFEARARDEGKNAEATPGQ